MYECEECTFHTNCKEILEDHIRAVHEVEEEKLVQRRMRHRRVRGIIDV